jgi:hypothetical protein
MQVQNSVGNIYGLAVTKFYTSPIPEEGRLGLKTLYLQDKYLSMAAKDRGERERGKRESVRGALSPFSFSLLSLLRKAVCCSRPKKVQCSVICGKVKFLLGLQN